VGEVRHRAAANRARDEEHARARRVVDSAAGIRRSRPAAVGSAGSPRSPLTFLDDLDRLRFDFDRKAAAQKLEALEALERATLRTSREVVRLHEAAGFCRVYPDDERVLGTANRLLDAFERRGDLRRFAARLADTGIAGTAIRFRFFHPMARWLVLRWPDALSIDWDELESRDLLEKLLPLIAPFAATPALDEYALETREWIDTMRGPRTDAAFLIESFERMRDVNPFAREMLYDELDVPMTLASGPDTPSRTRARSTRGRVFLQRRALHRERPDLAQEIERPPVAIRDLNERDGQEMIDLALASMVTRQRDLDVFAHGDSRDVRVFEYGEGLAFACIGVKPERRLMLEGVYGFLTLKNRVPIGYVLVASLFGSAEVAYNVFETFRGAEAAHVYARALAMIRTLFRADTFMVPPYQLGEGNDEAVESGAWWFYRKLGFAPRDAGVSRLMRAEEGRMGRNPEQRSSAATLRRLASAPLFWSPGAPRADVLGVLPLPNVGLHVLRWIADRYQGDKDWAFGNAVDFERRWLRLGDARRPVEEIEAINRWAHLVAILPGIDEWSPEERRAAGRVVLAKSGRRESDFVIAFDRHERLRAALRALAEREP
jgi:hypothetical protein